MTLIQASRYWHGKLFSHQHKYLENKQRETVKKARISRENLVLAEANFLSLDPNMHACYAACI
jgi:hypothetical protein